MQSQYQSQTRDLENDNDKVYFTQKIESADKEIEKLKKNILEIQFEKDTEICGLRDRVRVLLDERSVAEEGVEEGCGNCAVLVDLLQAAKEEILSLTSVIEDINHARHLLESRVHQVVEENNQLYRKAQEQHLFEDQHTNT